MLPASGRSKPAIMRRQVVLPEPDGPSSVKNSPRRMSMSTPSTATTSPYGLRTPASRMSGGSTVMPAPWAWAVSVAMCVFYRYWPTRCCQMARSWPVRLTNPCRSVQRATSAAGCLVSPEHDDHLRGAGLCQRVGVGRLLLADVELGGDVAGLVLRARL